MLTRSLSTNNSLPKTVSMVTSHTRLLLFKHYALLTISQTLPWLILARHKTIILFIELKPSLIVKVHSTYLLNRYQDRQLFIIIGILEFNLSDTAIYKLLY